MSQFPQNSPSVCLVVLVVFNSPQRPHSHKCLEDNYVSSLRSNTVTCILEISGTQQLEDEENN